MLEGDRSQNSPGCGVGVGKGQVPQDKCLGPQKAADHQGPSHLPGLDPHSSAFHLPGGDRGFWPQSPGRHSSKGQLGAQRDPATPTATTVF